MRRCESGRKAREVARIQQDAGFSAVARQMLAEGGVPVAIMADGTDMLELEIVGRNADLTGKPRWLHPAEVADNKAPTNPDLLKLADKLAHDAVCVLERSIRRLSEGNAGLRLVDVALGFCMHDGHLAVTVKAMRVLDGELFSDDYQLLEDSDRLKTAWLASRQQVHAAA